MNNIIITDVEHTVNVTSDICLNKFLEIFKRIFETKNQTFISK